MDCSIVNGSTGQQEGSEVHCERLQLFLAASSSLLIVMALVITVVLSCTTHRKNIRQECCWGRPGLFVPIHLLGRGPHRLVYAAIYGVMSDLFVKIVLDGAGDYCTETSENPSTYELAFCDVVLSKIVVVMLLCFFWGPLFACVNTPKPLLGHITGLIYLILLIVTFEVFKGTGYSGCIGETYDDIQIVFDVLSNLPAYVFYLFLLMWFVYQIANDMWIHTTHKENEYLYTYTRNLLKERKPIEQRRLKFFVWTYNKDFRFPLRFLLPLIVMVSIIFKLFFFMVNLAYMMRHLIDLLKSYRCDINNDTVYNFGLVGIKALIALTIISGVSAATLCTILLLQMVATVQKHLKLAAQGKFKFYSKTLPSHTDILVSSLKYGGYQIGYFVWAWFIFWIVSLTTIAVAVGAILALVFFFDIVAPQIFKYFLTVVWLPVVLITHKVMCKYVFLERDSRGKFLAITNRNGFDWYLYFMFFYNAIVGFVGAIIRVLLSLLFGTLLLFRLDQNIMMRGFEFADRGHKAYRGFLYLEHTYNNHVANTFVALLIDENEQRKDTPSFQDITDPVKNRRICNRWLVAYTLLHNPSVRPLRAPRLLVQEQQNQKEEEAMAEHSQKEKEAMAEGNVHEEIQLRC